MAPVEHRIQGSGAGTAGITIKSRAVVGCAGRIGDGRHFILIDIGTDQVQANFSSRSDIEPKSSFEVQVEQNRSGGSEAKCLLC